MSDMAMIITSMLFLIAIICLWAYLKREVFDPRGVSAHKKTAAILQKFAFLRRYKVLSNLKAVSPDGELFIENMLIGYFGILLVKTLGAKGDHYGTLSGESWSVVLNDRKTQYENPVRRLELDAAKLRSLLSKNKLYNIPIECIVYISSKSSKTTVSITNNGEIIMPGRLSGYLDKTKFEKDLGFDVEKIAKTLTESGFDK